MGSIRGGVRMSRGCRRRFRTSGRERLVHVRTDYVVRTARARREATPRCGQRAADGPNLRGVASHHTHAFVVMVSERGSQPGFAVSLRGACASHEHRLRAWGAAWLFVEALAEVDAVFEPDFQGDEH